MLRAAALLPSCQTLWRVAVVGHAQDAARDLRLGVAWYLRAHGCGHGELAEGCLLGVICSVFLTWGQANV